MNLKTPDIGNRLESLFDALQEVGIVTTPPQRVLATKLTFRFLERSTDSEDFPKLRNQLTAILSSSPTEQRTITAKIDLIFGKPGRSAMRVDGRRDSKSERNNDQPYNTDKPSIFSNSAFVLWGLLIATILTIVFIIYHSSDPIVEPTCATNPSICDPGPRGDRGPATPSNVQDGDFEETEVSPELEVDIVEAANKLRNALDDNGTASLAEISHRVYGGSAFKHDTKRWVRFLREATTKTAKKHDQPLVFFSEIIETDGSRMQRTENFDVVVLQLITFENSRAIGSYSVRDITIVLNKNNYEISTDDGWNDDGIAAELPVFLQGSGTVSTFLVAIPLLFAVMWLLGRKERARNYLQRRMPNLKPIVHEVTVSAGQYKRDLLQRSKHAAAKLGLHERVPGMRLDVNKTIQSTVDSGGWIQRRYEDIMVRPEYLVIVSRDGSADQHGKRIDNFVDALELEDITLVRYYMDANSNTFYQTDCGQSVSLKKLYEMYPDHRLIFVGIGDVFLNSRTLKPWPWALSLDQWANKALLSPVPPEFWRSREVSLARLFSTFPQEATLAGFEAAGEVMNLQEHQNLDPSSLRSFAMPFSWETRPERWLSISDPDDEEWDELLSDLERYFAKDAEDAIDWLATCAIYPSINWDIALYLGLCVTSRSAGILYSSQNSMKLSILPWFRAGYMPDPIRQRFLDHLKSRSPSVHRSAVLEISRLLAGTANIRNIPNHEAITLTIGQEDQDTKQAKVLKRRQNRDLVMVDRLAHEDVTDLVVPVGENWRDKATAFVDRHLFVESLKLCVFLAYAVALAFIVPWPNQGPLALNPWMPTLLLAAATLVCWLVYRRVAPSGAGKT